MQTGLSHWPTQYVLLLAAVFAACVMAFSSYLSGLIVGWRTLANKFASQSEPSGEVHTAGPLFYTVYWRFWIRYSGIVRITAAQNAIYLSAPFFFRAGHPRLCIPWNEIQFSTTKFLWRTYFALALGNDEKIPLRISRRMARNLGIIDRFPVRSSGGTASQIL